MSTSKLSSSSASEDIKPINICVLGEVGVGKSSIVLQFTKSYFPTDFDPYVEDTYSKQINIKDSVYRLNILDTANQDDYSPLKEVQLKEADGVIIVFRLNSNESFAEVSNAYSHIMRLKGSIPPILLVGNQSDLSDERQISVEESESLVKELGLLHYIEASARNNINISQSFLYLCERILERKIFKKASSSHLRAKSDIKQQGELKVDHILEEHALPVHHFESDIAHANHVRGDYGENYETDSTAQKISGSSNFEIISVLSQKTEDDGDEEVLEGDFSERSKQHRHSTSSSSQKRLRQKLSKAAFREKSEGGCCIIA